MVFAPADGGDSTASASRPPDRIASPNNTIASVGGHLYFPIGSITMKISLSLTQSTSQKGSSNVGLTDSIEKNARSQIETSSSKKAIHNVKD
jgi:hypothetical protein